MQRPSNNSQASRSIDFLTIAYFGGFLGVGTFVILIDDLLNAVTWQIAIVGSMSVLLFCGTLHVLLLNKIIRSQNITKRKLAAFTVGSLVVLWVAPFISFFQYSPDLPPVTPTSFPTPTNTFTPTPTFTPMPTFTPEPTPTPLPFSPATEKEILIVVADFDRAALVEDARVYEKIADAIKLQNNNQLIRIELEPTQLRSGDKQEAQNLGDQYEATLIIWGEEDAVSMEINFLNLKKAESDYDNVVVESPDIVYAQDRSLEYIKFVKNDLPDYLTFLSLFAIARAYNAEGKHRLALDTIVSANAQFDELLQSGLSEGMAEAHMLSGWLHNRFQEYDLAVESYNKVIKIDSDSSQAYNNRGEVKKKMGQVEEAIADYYKAIETGEEYSFYYYSNIGLAKVELEQYEEAIVHYNKAIEFDSTCPLSYLDRGSVKHYLEKYEQALSDYEYAMELHLHTGNGIARECLQYMTGRQIREITSTIHNNIGSAKGSLEMYKEAIIDYNKAVEINPSNSLAYLNRGSAKIDLEKYKEAITDYNTAIELDPNNPKAYTNRGVARYHLQHYTEAIADYTQAIALDPSFARAYYNRACPRLAFGLQDEASDDFERAYELGFQFPAVISRVGERDVEIPVPVGCPYRYSFGIPIPIE